METVKRIQKWDILKFILIFLVVFGHVVDTYFDESGWAKSLIVIIYSFHMPVFVFVSGLFSKKNIQQKRYDKIIGYLFMFFAVKIIIAFGRLIATGEMGFSILSEGGLPWYMLAMFAFQLVTIALRDFSPKYILIFSVILSCFAGYDIEIDDRFCLMRIIVFFPFFYLGYIVNPKKAVKFFENPALKIFSFILLAAFIAVVFMNPDDFYELRPLLTGRNSYEPLEDAYSFGGLIRLAYYIAAVIIGSAVICLVPKKLGSGRIARLGSRTLQIYSLHYFFIFLYSTLVGRSILPDHPAIMSVILAVLITAVCSFKFWEPVFNAIMNPKIINKKDTQNKIGT